MSDTASREESSPCLRLAECTGGLSVCFSCVGGTMACVQQLLWSCMLHSHSQAVLCMLVLVWCSTAAAMAGVQVVCVFFVRGKARAAASLLLGSAGAAGGAAAGHEQHSIGVAVRVQHMLMHPNATMDLEGRARGLLLLGPATMTTTYIAA
jgi:hypothetical protein